MTEAQSGWQTDATPQPNMPVAGGCEEAAYGVSPYQPCNRRAEVVVGFEGHNGQWRYCRQCANNRTGAFIICEYEGNDYVDPNAPALTANPASAWGEPAAQQVVTEAPAGWGQPASEAVIEGQASEVLPTEEAGEVEVGPQPSAEGWGVQTTEAAHKPLPETEEAKKRRLTAEVQDWTEAKEALTEAKEKEMSARLTLTSSCFPTPKKGTQRYPLEGGYNVKLAFGWNYSLGVKGKISDQGTEVSVYDQVVALERDIAALGPEGSLLVERLIKWKPELSVTEYEALSRDTASEAEVRAKALIDELLTVTPKSPTLEIEAPKPKK